ncbi:unnamed protein product [Lymnaea stagnalis]|uniref:cellulase n=1 Tax=Lymnaea stagnalis TaxID=6523 RepID=A0AAV2H7L0_LYMST
MAIMELFYSNSCLRVIILAVLFTYTLSDVDVTLTRHWAGGFQGQACFDVTRDLRGWNATFKFDDEIETLMSWQADVIEVRANGTVYILRNTFSNEHVTSGAEFCILFIGTNNGTLPNLTASLDQLPGGGHHVLPEHNITSVYPTTSDGVTATMVVSEDWTIFKGQFQFPVSEDMMSWLVNITYDMPVVLTSTNVGKILSNPGASAAWSVVNNEHQPILHPGDTFSLSVNGRYQVGPPTPKGRAVLLNLGKDRWIVLTAPQNFTSKYNYDDALMKSIMFYDAQRSGPTGADNRIPYRGDSGLNDMGDNGESLVGGWYNGAGTMKYTATIAYSTTMLIWGYLAQKDAYQSAGQQGYFLDSIKWSLDYLIKCHTQPEELYIQIGNLTDDQHYWGAPELMNQSRPTYKVNATHPGSDVSMETAAAFASGYLAFKDDNGTFSSTLLDHAKKLWDFALAHQGRYSDSQPTLEDYYSSTNLTDMFCWGSVWLYQTTQDTKYLTAAESYVDLQPYDGLTPLRSSRKLANQLLLYQMTNKTQYRTYIENAFVSIFPGGDVPYTPKGLVFYSQQPSSNLYSADISLLALMAADAGIHPAEYKHWSMCQVHYILGDTGFSYVVGFGDKYPLRAQHKASSCPISPAPCGELMKVSSLPNVHILYGALVAGPDLLDHYRDDRTDADNSVGIIYNSGLQGAIAGLQSLILNGQHPEQTGTHSCPYTPGLIATTDGIIGK